MSVTLIPEDDLRRALGPYRAEPSAFEAAVREQIERRAEEVTDPLAELPPVARAAAAFLPLEVIAAGKIAGAGVKLAPATGGYKLLGYLAFPAISLFVLLGATIYSVIKIRSLRGRSEPNPSEEAALEAGKRWWRRNWWTALLVYGVTFALPWFGATWLLFAFYIVSCGLLLYVLTSLAKVGLCDRLRVSQSCLWGLLLLASTRSLIRPSSEGIHFLDQGLISWAFHAGVMALLLIQFTTLLQAMKTGSAIDKYVSRSTAMVVFLIVVGPMTVFLLIVASPLSRPLTTLLRPITPDQIKDYVESFDSAPYSSADWTRWEIPASWVIERNLNPDLTKPQRLLEAEIDGQQNPFVLGTGFRMGMVTPNEVDHLSKYEVGRRSLLDQPKYLKKTQAISSVEQFDWVIRAAVLRNDLTSEERDLLAKRLHVTLEEALVSQYRQLETPLRITQLLAVIGRPVNPDHYRAKVQEMLRAFHSTDGGGFDRGGGFKDYDTGRVEAGSLKPTAYAIQLMSYYGIPEGLDFNWVRSYLRPNAIQQPTQAYMAAVTLDRLNHLPGATHPTWFQWLYYERTLLAACVLVGLCIYATLSSPKPVVPERNPAPTA